MEERIAALESAVMTLHQEFVQSLPEEKSRAGDDGGVSRRSKGLRDEFSILKRAIERLQQQMEAITTRTVHLESLFADAISIVSKAVDVHSGSGEDPNSVVEKLVANVDSERRRYELKELRRDFDSLRLRHAIGGRQCELETTPTRYVLDLHPYTPAFVQLADLSCKIGTGSAQLEAVACTPPPGLESENDSRGKHCKRQEIIQITKRKDIYIKYTAIVNQGEALPCEVPGTPDPADETISKRKWESLVAKWRGALRQVSKLRGGGDADEPDELADLPARSGGDPGLLFDALESE